MNGKSLEQIKTRFDEIKAILKQRFPNDKINIIDSLWTKNKQNPVWCLGYNIMAMSQADLIVFDKGWRLARGCKIEFDICSYYGFRFLEI